MPWGMAILAMVMPASKSNLNSVNLYLGPHSNIGAKYLRNAKALRWGGRPRKWRKGSSGKKVSLSFSLKVTLKFLYLERFTLCLASSSVPIGEKYSKRIGKRETEWRRWRQEREGNGSYRVGCFAKLEGGVCCIYRVLVMAFDNSYYQEITLPFLSIFGVFIQNF